MKGKVVFLLSGILLSLFIGCSPRVMSVFFDGVPDGTDSVHAAAAGPAGRPDTTSGIRIIPGMAEQTKYFHPPYQNKKCKLCHDPAVPVKLLLPQPELCYNCHDNFTYTYKVVHGPVNGGCTACHSPHVSDRKKMLLRPGQDLCLYCHRPKDVFSKAAHTGSEKTDCMDCHNPHGGDDRHLLKKVEK